jgi:lipoprotein-anchoring transpeptidase ErfK/SrfK
MAIFTLGILPAGATATRPIPVSVEFARTSTVTLWDQTFTQKRSFETFEKTFLRGAFLAAGDVDGDGKDELVVGSGPGRTAEVRVYSTDEKELSHFLPYGKFAGGVRIAVGDLDGDGRAEIVTSPGPGMAAEIGIFDKDGNRKVPAAFAYPEAFLGGARVAIGDFDRNGTVDIATAPGPGGGPHVRLFNGKMEAESGMDFFAFDGSMREGVTLATVRTPWGVQLVTGVESWSSPLVRRYSFDAGGPRLDKEFYAFATSSRSGVIVGAFDLDHDGTDEILAAGNGGSIPEVRIYDLYGTPYGKYLLQDPTYRGALSFAQVDADGDRAAELAVSAVAPTVIGPTNIEKSIYVDLADQRLYAFERGRIARTFFVSTGVSRHPTPEMVTSVLDKIPVKRYMWNYGPGNPDNYNLPNVKWNLRITSTMFIHSAYWHHNFGYRMSHGCINTELSDADWIYHWADVGTPVQTVQGLKKISLPFPGKR